MIIVTILISLDIYTFWFNMIHNIIINYYLDIFISFFIILDFYDVKQKKLNVKIIASSICVKFFSIDNCDNRNCTVVSLRIRIVFLLIEFQKCNLNNM